MLNYQRDPEGMFFDCSPFLTFWMAGIVGDSQPAVCISGKQCPGLSQQLGSLALAYLWLGVHTLLHVQPHIPEIHGNPPSTFLEISGRVNFCGPWGTMVFLHWLYHITLFVDVKSRKIRKNLNPAFFRGFTMVYPITYPTTIGLPRFFSPMFFALKTNFRPKHGCPGRSIKP